ncbi:MAG TPA: TfuA domain-containing protein [Kofleriaceae bacterium]|nr:TfuA domain-containing protein [Kofleriaceae bacterium]
MRELLPAAVVRPPAAVGDILRAAHDKRVARIAIIDGYFERMAAVWHKEILIALERGIEAWGAASMGALRAAELEGFGMRGVGEIFKLYKRSVITADDEVAVAHLPAEYGYRAVSDALVNIRWSLAVATDEGLIDPKLAARLLIEAKATFYRDRVWKKLAPELPLIDLKAADARLLLQKLRRSGKAPRRKIPGLRVPRTWALRQLERLML